MGCLLLAVLVLLTTFLNGLWFCECVVLAGICLVLLWVYCSYNYLHMISLVWYCGGFLGGLLLWCCDSRNMLVCVDVCYWVYSVIAVVLCLYLVVASCGFGV